MTDNQMTTIIVSIGIPMIAGFGWIIKLILDLSKDMRHIDSRLSRMEGYIEGSKIRIVSSDK